MRIFTNKGYQRDLDRRREEVERRIYDSKKYSELWNRMDKLEERIVNLENYKPVIIEHGERRWKKY